MVYVLAVGAAFANALTTLLQRLGVEQAPAGSTMRVALISYAVRRPVWLAGFAVMVAAFVLQASALSIGTLTEVQPTLTAELPLLVVMLAVWFHRLVSWHEWFGAFAAAGGLAAFLAAAAPGGGTAIPGLDTWLITSLAVLAVAAAAVLGSRWGSPARQAGLLGAAAALLFALTAAFTKQVTVDVSQRWSGLFTHWHVYAMAVSGLLAVFVAQSSFHAGPVTASQTALVLVDPLASIAIGINLFGDRLAADPGRLVVEVLGALLAASGVVLLARSRLVAAVHGTDETSVGRVRPNRGELYHQPPTAPPVAG